MVTTINDAPKGYKSLGYEKARIVGLDQEKAKIKMLWVNSQMLPRSLLVPSRLGIGHQWLSLAHPTYYPSK